MFRFVQLTSRSHHAHPNQPKPDCATLWLTKTEAAAYAKVGARLIWTPSTPATSSPSPSAKAKEYRLRAQDIDTWLTRTRMGTRQMSDLTKRIDLFKLRIALEDAKAERDNYLGLLVRETATKAGLACRFWKWRYRKSTASAQIPTRPGRQVADLVHHLPDMSRSPIRYAVQVGDSLAGLRPRHGGAGQRGYDHPRTRS